MYKESLRHKTLERWETMLCIWLPEHQDVSMSVKFVKFLGMRLIRIRMRWLQTNKEISREISYIEYMSVHDPRQFILDTYDKMYKEGGKQDA